MAVMLFVGAGPLAALMAADRKLSARVPSNLSSRSAVASDPSSTAMEEGVFHRERNDASRRESASGARVSHSHTTSDDQPLRFSAARTATSRCWLRAILARQ